MHARTYTPTRMKSATGAGGAAEACCFSSWLSLCVYICSRHVNILLSFDVSVVLPRVVVPVIAFSVSALQVPVVPALVSLVKGSRGRSRAVRCSSFLGEEER